LSQTVRAAVLHVESALRGHLPPDGGPAQVEVPFWSEQQALQYAASLNRTFGGLLPHNISNNRLGAVRDALRGLQPLLEEGEEDLVQAWVKLLAEPWCGSASFVNWLVENEYGTHSLPPDEAPYYVRLNLLPPPQEVLQRLKDAAGVKAPPVVLDPSGLGAKVMGKFKRLTQMQYAVVKRLLVVWP
jgi:hypothetical protein